MSVPIIYLGLFLIFVYHLCRYFWEKILLENLKNRAVFITGCDSGFGRAIAIKCAKHGIPTFAGCFTTKGSQILEYKAKYLSSTLKTVPLDVTSDESVKSAYKFVEENLQSNQMLWAIINNAGAATSYGPVEWTTTEQIEKAFDVNTLGIVRVVKAFLPLLKKSQGRILTTSSVFGRVYNPYTCSFNISKYGVEVLMDTLRAELKPWSIKCCVFEPTHVTTPMFSKYEHWKNLIDFGWNQLTDDLKEEYGEEFKLNLITTRIQNLKHFNPNISQVVDDYYHALTAKYPRSRYACGWAAKFYYIPLSLCPSEVQDWIHSRLYGKLIKTLPNGLRKEKRQ